MLVKIKTFLYNKQTGGSMEKYSFHNLNPYKNTIYKDFYDRLFHDLETYYTMLGFPENCGTICNKAIYMPWDFIDLLGTRAMKASFGKIQTAHSYKQNDRMEDSRYEHMCFAYMLGVDLLLILEKNGYQIDAKTEVAFLLKLLLHDNGHGPFSHPFEEMVDGYKGMHEDIGDRNLQEDQELQGYLEGIFPGLTNYIIHFKEQEPYGLHELVEGIFDLDRAAFLILDSWLSNEKLFPENSWQNVQKLIQDIYVIFENIMLVNGKVFYNPNCFYEMERFIGKRAYNYIHLYNEPGERLDDMLLHEYGVQLLKQKSIPNTFTTLLKSVIDFKQFLKEMKEKQAAINLDDYFQYIDQDIHRIVHLSELFENEDLRFCARGFLASNARMMQPFILEETNSKKYEEETTKDRSLMHAKVKINIYKSTPEEHIIFMNPDTGEQIDFKDMQERTLDITPIQKFYLFHRKKAEKPLANEALLREIFTDYFYTHSENALLNCSIGESYEKNSINKQKFKVLIPLLEHLSKGKPIEEYAKQHHMSFTQLYVILSFYTYDTKWADFATFMTLPSEGLHICFKEISFDSSNLMEKFLTKIRELLETNVPNTDTPTYCPNMLFERLCISKSNIVFLDLALLNSIEISEMTRKKILGLCEQRAGYQKRKD